MTKKWYQSKTVWVNLATLIAAAIANKVAEVIEHYIELMILALINMFLRIITREEIN